MSTNPVFNKGVDSVKAVAAIVGKVPVGKKVARVLVLASAAATAFSAFVADNAVLLDVTPTSVDYVGSAVAAAVVVIRIFAPAE